MYKDNSIAVVVPAYNEEGYVGGVIDTIPSFVDVAYVVEDGSTDGTWGEIVEHAATVNEETSPEAPAFDRRVVPIRHEENRGVGGALKTGYLRALEDGVDITAVLGGDGQMDPQLLTKYLDPIAEGDADYAKGNRFLKTEQLDAMPRFRLVGNTILSYLTKFASGYWSMMDPQNGYTAISHEALERVDVEEMYEYYGYCNDLLVKLNAEGLRIADVSHSAETVYDEEDWKSHIDYTEYIPLVSAMLLRNFGWRLRRKYLVRDFHPLVGFYTLGTLLSGLGVFGSAAAVLRRRGESDAGVANWGFALVLGLVLILFGALLDKRDNDHLELQVDDDDYESGLDDRRQAVEADD